jgi:cysteine desulfurase
VDVSDLIYLDHAAATPLSSEVLAAMQPYFSDAFYNPSSPYAPAVTVRHEYEAAKARLAACIGAKPAELVMTAGATESINLAIRGVGGHVVTSATEHESVLAAARRGEHTIVGVTSKGRVEPEAIRRALRPDTQLVSIALANGEIGTIQPLNEIAAVIREERAKRQESGSKVPLHLHSDASQGAGLLDIHVARLGVDLLTVNAGKIYGPKQVGLLWADRSLQLHPQIVGGGQERGLRSGTENVAGVIGFAAALDIAERRRKAESERLGRLRDKLEAQLVDALPQSVISGDSHRRLPSHLHISFPGIDGERLVFALESKGILVSTGSACAANRGTRSHVLTAIGLPPEVADGSLRLSLGRLSEESTMERAGSIIIEEVRREYQRIGK